MTPESLALHLHRLTGDAKGIPPRARLPWSGLTLVTRRIYLDLARRVLEKFRVERRRGL